MSLNISYSSQLMDNYVQYDEELIDRSSRFEALQTKEGHTLFFCLGTDGQFHLIKETSFHETGWRKISLTEQIKSTCFGNSTMVKVKTFDVRQNEKTGTIHLATIITVDGKDQLVQVMGVDNQDDIWEKPLAWQAIVFDDRTYSRQVVMEDVFVCHDADSTWSVVDILRNPSDSVRLLRRYYIEHTGAQKWHLHDVSVDLEAGKSINIIGRLQDEEGDGIYTLGNLQGKQQLIYHPLYNYDFPNISPNPTRLYLDNSVNIDAIALTSLHQNSYTDVFAIGGNALYYFSAENQSEGSVGKKLIEDDIFISPKSMYAQNDGKQVVVWGLNASGEVYYTSCEINKIEASDAWSHPLPLVDGAHQIAPYLNRTNSGNTFFAHTGTNTLVKLEQSPSTSLWTEDPIMLEAPIETKATKIKSFTTEIRVTDKNDDPLIEEEIWLSAASRGSFLINGKYVVLDEHKRKVRTNHAGNISIIEMVEDIKGETIFVHGSDKTVEIDPTKNAIDKLTSLDTPEKLKAATVNDGKGNISSLVDGNTSQEDLKNAAAVFKELSSIVNKQPTVLKSAKNSSVQSGLIPIASFSYTNPSFEAQNLDLPKRKLGGFFKNVWAKTGDALRYIGNAVKKAAQFTLKVLKDAATGIYTFTCTIGKTVINFVVTAAKAVAKVCVKIFEAIKTAAEKVWNFLKFLFSWEDIKQTKKLLKNLIRMGIEEQVEGIKSVKSIVHQELEEVKNQIKQLKKTLNGKAQLANTQEVLSSNKKYDKQMNSSETTFLDNHLRNNADKTQMLAPLPPEDTHKDDTPDFKIEHSLWEEVGLLFSKLSDQITQRTFNFNDILDSLLDIADKALTCLQSGIDWLFDKVMALIQTIYEILDTPIYIPVLSSILEDVLGIPAVSILDIICYLIALPTTILYKIATGKAPVEKSNTELQSIIDWESPAKTKNAPSLWVEEHTDVYQEGQTGSFALGGVLDHRMKYSEKSNVVSSLFSTVFGKLSLHSKKVLFGILKIARGVIKCISALLETIDLGKKASSNGYLSFASTWRKILKVADFALSLLSKGLLGINYGTWFTGPNKVFNNINLFLKIAMFVIKDCTRQNKFVKWDIDKNFLYPKMLMGIISAGMSVIQIVHIVMYASTGKTALACGFSSISKLSSAIRPFVKYSYIQSKNPKMLAAFCALQVLSGITTIGEGVTILNMDDSEFLS